MEQTGMGTIQYPVETVYLGEVIRDLLVTYKTVSISRTKDDVYIINVKNSRIRETGEGGGSHGLQDMPVLRGKP